MAFKSRDVTPYYESVHEYVNSLPYDKPLNKFDGYVYRNPLTLMEEGRLWCGRLPTFVYENLFKEDTYMIVSKEELKTMRTTIQYIPLALNDMHKKLCDFVKRCGFRKLSRTTTPWRWDNSVKFIRTSFLRDDIKVVLSSLSDAQEYIPNAIPILSLEKVQKNPETNRLNTVTTLSSFDWIPVEDELGEKSIESFENYLKSKI